MLQTRAKYFNLPHVKYEDNDTHLNCVNRDQGLKKRGMGKIGLLLSIIQYVTNNKWNCD
jgi:hypothetical protein